MIDQDLFDLIERLRDFNIAIVERTMYEYTVRDQEISDMNQPPIKFKPYSLKPAGLFTDVYGYFINSLNRTFVLFLEIEPETVGDSVRYYDMNIHPKCEACLILLIGAFETYLADKFDDLRRKLKIYEDLGDIKFHNKKDVKRAFRSINIKLLSYNDEREPERKDQIEWEDRIRYLWNKFFADDIGYVDIRHEITHTYLPGLNKYGEPMFIDKQLIKNCLLDIAEIIFKFEEKINLKHEDLIKLRNWDSTTIQL
ncbi:hypothetical protein LCGC14_1497620 [marine sediment metagenome]|uniref:Uncharacterized protein n=1 Tax=marine sediment metagenome TaxID=412755 RepID=A0A0F9LKN8_9ZZZZ